MDLERAIEAFRKGTNPGEEVEQTILRALRQHPPVLYALGERRRQIEALGFTPDLDDREAPGNLASAAMAMLDHARLILTSGAGATTTPSHFWPWAPSTWHPPITPEDALVKASALVFAELDRMARRATEESLAARA